MDYSYKGIGEILGIRLIWKSGDVVFGLTSSSVGSAELISMGESIKKRYASKLLFSQSLRHEMEGKLDCPAFCPNLL